MNQDQFLSWLRTTLGGVGYLATAYGVTSSSTVATVIGIVMAGAPYVWGIFAHDDAAKVLAAAAVEGLEPIKVTSAAPASVQALANDRSVPSVVPVSPYDPARR